MSNKTTLFITLLLMSIGVLTSCGSAKKEETKKSDNTEQSSQKEETKESKEDSKEETKSSSERSEADIKKFIVATEGFIGWKRKNEPLLLISFFEDGGLSVQGDQGEATMWSGKWKIAGDKIEIECKNCGNDIKSGKYDLQIEEKSQTMTFNGAVYEKEMIKK